MSADRAPLPYRLLAALVVLGLGLSAAALPLLIRAFIQYRQAAWIGWPVALILVWQLGAFKC